MTLTQLFDSSFLARLDRLELLSRKTFSGRTAGKRRSCRRGHGVEFVDYRNYVQGDDLRYLDWNIYGRLERLFLKISLQEEDIHVHFLLDASASMSFGSPSKFDHARRIAAALAYVALGSLDRVEITSFREGLSERLQPCRGKGSIFKIMEFLDRLETEGQTGLLEACRRYRVAEPSPGVVFLISDFLDPSGFEDALRHFISRRFDLCLVQVLARGEVEPDLSGDLRLVDIETGQAHEVSIGPAVMKRYRRTFDFFCGSLRRFAMERDVAYVRTISDEPFDRLVLNTLRSLGVLR